MLKQYQQSLRRVFWGGLVVLCIGGHALAQTQRPDARSNSASRSWTEDERRRHALAARNCDAARAVGLAPAYRGEPGYYPKHDRDNDGIACEVYRRR